MAASNGMSDFEIIVITLVVELLRLMLIPLRK